MDRREVEGGDEGGQIAGMEVPVIAVVLLEGRIGPEEAAGVVDDVEVRS